MFQIFISLFHMLIAVVSGDRSIKRMAGFAFACLAFAVGASVLTAWLSYPAYAAMVPSVGSQAVWGIAGLVAGLMFFATSAIGIYIAEATQGVKPSISAKTLGFIFLVTVLVGGFDAYKGYQVGAVERGRELHPTLAFEQSELAQAKPYQNEINNIEARIDQLLSDNNKVMDRGRLVTAWPDRQTANRLSKELEALYAKQREAIDEQRSLHANKQAHVATLQTEAATTLQGVSIVLYVVMIFLAIPVGIFDVLWDLRDGVRDGRNAEVQSKPKPKGPGLLARIKSMLPRKEVSSSQPRPVPTAQGKPIGYKQSPGESSNAQNGESPYARVGSKLGNPQGRDLGTKPPVNSPGNPHPQRLHNPQGNPHVGNSAGSPERLPNSHPRFSKNHQPEDGRSIDEKKYKKFVVIAQAVHEEQGRYVQTQIANRSGLSLKTVRKYLTTGVDRGDLEE